MTTYTFSVVATNSIGSGEAGIVMIATPGEFSLLYIIMHTCISIILATICLLEYITYVCLYVDTYITIRMHSVTVLEITFKHDIHSYCQDYLDISIKIFNSFI